MPNPLRLIAWLLAAVVIGAPLAGLALFLTAILGGPGPCESDGRVIAFTPEAAVSFQQKWDGLNATLDAGQAASAVFDESEATSRARQWVEEHDVPVSDLLICFNDDGASASAKVDVPLLPGDFDVLVRGTLIMTDEHAQADLDEVEVGNLPGQVTELVKGLVDELIEDQARETELRHDYGLAFSEGAMTISGQP